MDNQELARHGYDISPGTLYPTLHRLEADGLLSSKQRVVDGRARRVYRVMAAGRRALREDRKALQELAGRSSASTACRCLFARTRCRRRFGGRDLPDLLGP